MQCSRCLNPAILYQRYSGRHLCCEHLVIDIKTRAKRVIRQHTWLVKGDHIGVFTGSRFGETLYLFLEDLVTNRNDITVSRIEGPDPRFAGESTRHQTFSDLLSSSGITRFAFPDSADDIAVGILSSLLTGDIESILTGGETDHRIAMMFPFREIPDEELEIYTRKLGITQSDHPVDPNGISPFQHAVRDLLTVYSASHPSVLHSLRRYGDALHVLAMKE